MDRKKLAIKVAAGLLITAIVTLVSVSVTSPGLAQVLANFNWLFALRALTGVAGAAFVVGIIVILANDFKYPDPKIKWWLVGTFTLLTLVCVTTYAGLWR